MEEKGKPKKDGSGKGIRANEGRGGCYPTKSKSAEERINKSLDS